MQPLTHHEIIALVEPFARRGRHVDLGASNRRERIVVFKAALHVLETPSAATVRETLTLANPREGLVRPDKLDDTQAQVANDHLVGASPRGWADISNVLKSGLSQDAKRVFVQGRIGAATAAEFFGVLRELQAAVDVVRLLAARPGEETLALLPRTLDGLYGMVYGLLAASTDAATLSRALQIVEQVPETRAAVALPLREAQTLAMELLMQKALEGGLESAVLDSASYRRYAEHRRKEGQGG